jgi:F420-non-reducing hydrogenase iron-sulfur subunit
MKRLYTQSLRRLWCPFPGERGSAMAVALSPDVVVYVCTNCIPQSARLPRQWKQDGAQVLVREVPCSGKIDGQYLFHALEAGGRGICVVACPKGECHLAQGNYRAEIRVRTVQRLLAEIGFEPQRAELVHCSADDPPEKLEQLVRGAVTRICAIGDSPLHAAR